MDNRNPIDTAVFDVLTIAPTDPAVGANFSQALNLNSRWQIIYVEFILATDVNAANRLIKVHGNDGTDDIYLTGPNVPLTANLTARYFCNTGAGDADDLGAGSRLAVPLNTNFYLNQADTFRITIDSIQVGDQISDIRIRVKQWIVEN